MRERRAASRSSLRIAFAPGQPLPFDTHEFSVILPDDVPRNGGNGNGKQRDVTWKIRFAKAEGLPINIEALKAYCQGGEVTNAALIAITALNVLLRHDASHNPNNIVKASSIYPGYPDGQAPGSDRTQIPGGLELWRGFYSSLRPSPGGMILNVDSTAIAMVRSGNLPEIIGAYLGVSNPQQLSQVSDGSRIKVGRFLRGVAVKVMVGASREPARRKISEFSPLPANQRTFENSDGQTVTVADYFRSLNVALRFPNLGCVRVTKTAWYPIETVTVLPGNKYAAKLDAEQIAKMLDFTSKKPQQKRDLIRQGLNKLGYNTNPTVQGWQTQINEQPLGFNARVLPPPNLLAGGPKQSALVRSKDDGQFDARSKPFFKPAAIASWCVAES